MNKIHKHILFFGALCIIIVTFTSCCDITVSDELSHLSLSLIRYLESYFPEELLPNIIVKAEGDSGNFFMDGYYVYILTYSDEIKNEIMRIASRGLDWKPLPITNSDYNELIKERLNWSLRDFNYFEEYNLTSSNCFGYWQFRGQERVFTEWYIYSDNESFPVYNNQELIVLLEEDNTILLVHQVS